MITKKFLPNYCIDVLCLMLFIVPFSIFVCKDVDILLLTLIIVFVVICVTVFAVSTIILVNKDGIFEKKGFKKLVLKFEFKGICDVQFLDGQREPLQKDATSRELVLNNNDTRYCISINNYNEHKLLAELSKYTG